MGRTHVTPQAERHGNGHDENEDNAAQNGRERGAPCA